MAVKFKVVKRKVLNGAEKDSVRTSTNYVN